MARIYVTWSRRVRCEMVVTVPDELVKNGHFVGSRDDLNLPTLFNGEMPLHVTEDSPNPGIFDTEVVTALVDVRDLRAADLLWKMLDRDEDMS